MKKGKEKKESKKTKGSVAEMNQLIDTVVANFDKKIKLNSRGLKSVPKKVYKAADLEDLDLSDNLLKSVDSGIIALTNLKKLDLNNNDIDAIPKDLAKLPALLSLDMTGNKISHIPEVIGTFPKLRRLVLATNDIRSIDKALADAQSIRHLDLSFNNFKGNIPPELREISKLQKFYFSGNEMQFIPHKLMDFRDLTHLGLDHNEISHLDGIGSLSSLEYLSLKSNSIQTLPAEIGKLENLTVLNLAQNGIYDLPVELKNLKQLEILNLADNALSSIPEWFMELRGMKELDLTRNKLQNIPAEFGFLLELEKLSLAGNSLVDLPFELGLCEKLTELNLQGNASLTIPPQGVRREGVQVVCRWLRARIQASHYTSSAGGPGLEGAVAGEEAHFDIIARDIVGSTMSKSGDVFKVVLNRVSQSEDDPPISIGGRVISLKNADTERGIYRSLFLTSMSGEYMVDITLNGNHIKGSPHRVIVRPTDCTAESCVASGIGTVAYVGQRMTFRLLAKDRFGNTLTTTPDGDFFVSIVGKSGVVDCLIKNMKDGSFAVTWSPPSPGPFIILVKWQNEQISGSPFRVQGVMKPVDE